MTLCNFLSFMFFLSELHGQVLKFAIGYYLLCLFLIISRLLIYCELLCKLGVVACECNHEAIFCRKIAYNSVMYL